MWVAVAANFVDVGLRVKSLLKNFVVVHLAWVAVGIGKMVSGLPIFSERLGWGWVIKVYGIEMVLVKRSAGHALVLVPGESTVKSPDPRYYLSWSRIWLVRVSQSCSVAVDLRDHSGSGWIGVLCRNKLRFWGWRGSVLGGQCRSCECEWLGGWEANSGSNGLKSGLRGVPNGVVEYVITSEVPVHSESIWGI